MILRNGTLKASVLDRSVYKRLGNIRRQQSPDTGTVSGTGIAMASSACTLKTQYAALLSVLHSVNSLAVQGAVPEQIETTVLLPEGTQEQLLRDLEDQIREAALMTGVLVSGGHTEVTTALNSPIVSVVCSGHYRNIPGSPDQALSSTSKNAAGMDIVITKWIGMEGTWLLSEEKEQELLGRFPARFLYRAKEMRDQLSVVQDAEIAFRSSPDPVMISAGTGGIYAALWQLCSRLHAGFEIDIHSIPVLQETIEITDHFELDPYETGSLGSLVIAARGGACLVEALQDAGIHAAIAGRLISDREMRIVNGDEIRNLNMPSADALVKILG